MEKKWDFFIKEVGELVFFWVFGIIYFTLFRFFFISFFSKELSDNLNTAEFLKVFSMGFRFDTTAVCYFMIIPVLSLLIFIYFKKFDLIVSIRKWLQVIFIVISTIISVVTINFYMEYNNQFNNFLFLVLYDDKTAVTNTILKEYHPITNILAILLIIIFSLFLFKWFKNRRTVYHFLKKFETKTSKISIVFMVVLFFVIALRGSISMEPTKRRMTSISKDIFLNKTIMNPFRSLLYAYSDFKEINNTDGKNPFLNNEEFEKIYTKAKVSDYLEKKAKGAMIEKPKQIFIIVMESYDSWPLLDKYKDFGVANQLRTISEKGISFMQFLPASTATFNSFSAIVTNIPFYGMNLSQIGASKEQYITSIFTQFKTLGYHTNLFYGGLSSWENIYAFTKHQGVDHFFSGPEAGGQLSDGLWGVPDRNLFNLVLKNVNPNEYSLNVILTTSYHPPFSIDLEKENYPLKSTDDLPKNALKYYDNGMNLKELGHLWYGDKAIGEFVENAEKKFENSIFCFTGDHYGRRFINHKPTLYEKSSVPFILYGKEIKPQKIKTPGTHIDIMPTLIEMIAPKDFVYYSFGESLFSNDKNFAVAYRRYLNNEELYLFPKEEKIHKLNFKTNTETLINQSVYEKEHNNLMSLAWYFTMKGNDLKSGK